MDLTEINLKIQSFQKLLYDISKEVQEIEDNSLKSEKVVSEILKVNEKISGKLQISSDRLGTYTSQLLTLYNEILENSYRNISNLFSEYKSDLLQKYNELLNSLQSLSEELKRTDYLTLVKDKNVILVGGNGAGKSSFASYLKNSLSKHIVVIPAQKFLYFDNKIVNLHLTNRLDISTIQDDNFIQRGRFENSTDPYAVSKLMKDLSHLFSRLVTVIANEQLNQEHKILNSIVEKDDLEEKKIETILYKFNKIWKNLIPDIDFEIDTLNRTLIPWKDGSSYSLNGMSDGEKSILYYMCHVFLAKEDSFIVVDEPETFLNASNFNRLWDTLELLRPDCKFIYISHVMDFVVSRTNVELLWCKQYNHPNNWDIVNILYDDNISDSFPRELISELIGSRKSILFCEGTKASLDYAIYSSLFKEDVIVHPVEGHNQVIQYTKAYNDSPIFSGNVAYGIIDLDLMNEEQIVKYREDKIYTLPFNEIEMLLFTDEVMKELLNVLFDVKEVGKKISEFKNALFKLLNEQKEIVIRQKIKKDIDMQLSNYRVKDKQATGDMINEIKVWLDDLQVNERAQQFAKELEEAIENRNYEKILKLCPLKEGVSKGLANKYLDSSYVNKALIRIKQNESLNNLIRRKYLSEIKIN